MAQQGWNTQQYTNNQPQNYNFQNGMVNSQPNAQFYQQPNIQNAAWEQYYKEQAAWREYYLNSGYTPLQAEQQLQIRQQQARAQLQQQQQQGTPRFQNFANQYTNVRPTTQPPPPQQVNQGFNTFQQQPPQLPIQNQPKSYLAAAQQNVKPLNPITRLHPPIVPGNPSPTTNNQIQKTNLPGSAGWPDTLKNYVQRALQSNPRDLANVQQALRQIIQKAVADNQLWEINWDNEPPPLVKLNSISNSPTQQKIPKPVLPHVGSLPVPPKNAGSISYAPSGTAYGESPNQRKRRWDSPADQQPNQWPARKDKKSKLIVQSPHQQHAFGTTMDNKKGKQKKSKKNKKKERRNSLNARTPEEQLLLQKRAERFQKKTNVSISTWNPDEHKINKLEVTRAMERAERYGFALNLDEFVVTGTSTELEKPYLRLTSAPDPTKVRPEPILKQSISMVQEHHKNKTKPYLWICEQLKSIRQDLTVQHIKNQFTAEVYEVHARIALEQTDMKEFNQCQTQLQELYANKKLKLGTNALKAEFAAYGILYNLYTRYKYGAESSIIATSLQLLDHHELKSLPVKHALQIQASIDQGDFALFFQLYKCVPNQGIYLLNLIVDFVRFCAIQRITKAIRPNIPLDFVHDQLCFNRNGSKEEKEKWDAFLTENKLVFVANNNNLIDAKLSQNAVNHKFVWAILDGDNVNYLETEET